MSWPIYCGHDHAGTGCVELAVVLIDATPGRARTACPAHRAAVERWVTAGGGQVAITPITQPTGAVAGDGQATLFDDLGTTP